MNLRLTLLAAAVATVAAPTHAASALELYGKLNLTVQNTDTDTGAAASTGDIWEAKSNASRLGVKGELSISEGFDAFYQIELQVNSVETAGSAAPFSSRNVGAGLRGGLGQILVGRWDTPLKLSQGKVDLFNDTDGDLTAIFNGETRAANIVTYSTPKVLGNLVFSVASLLQEKVDDGTPANSGQDGPADALSWSAEWQGKDLFLSVAQDYDHNTGTFSTAGAETSRVTGTYKLGAFQLGAMYQEYDNGTGSTEDGILASLSWKLNDSNTLKFQTGQSDIKGLGGEQTFIGWDHNLAKNVMLYAFYGEQTFDSLSTSTPEKTFLAFGTEVKF